MPGDLPSPKAGNDSIFDNQRSNSVRQRYRLNRRPLSIELYSKHVLTSPELGITPIPLLADAWAKPCDPDEYHHYIQSRETIPPDER